VLACLACLDDSGDGFDELKPCFAAWTEAKHMQRPAWRRDASRSIADDLGAPFRVEAREIHREH
jgi:hypothetical protein